MYRDSDGYILIDMGAADISKSTQSIVGFYDRIVESVNANKLVLVINFGTYSPMPAIAHKKLNYYEIVTNLYKITINSNDIVIIEETGESTVDVSIVPTLQEGVKIADFAIGEVEGSIYAPEQVDVINDNVTAENTTWSSDKIDNELDKKADSSSLATVATSGSYTDLTNKPAIPADLDDLSDVTLTSPANGQTLVYDSTSEQFVNATPPSGVTALSQLSDVTITSAADGNVLKYDGSTSKWVNESIDIEDLNNVTLTTSDNNKLLGVSVSGSDISVGAVNTPFKIATFSSSNYSIAANGTQHMAIDFITVPSGYTLAGIVGFATNQASVGVSVMRLTTSGSWALQLFNTSNSALSGQPFEVTVLFIKSSLL